MIASQTATLMPLSHLVSDWLCCHLYHHPFMRFAGIQLRRVCSSSENPRQYADQCRFVFTDFINTTGCEFAYLKRRMDLELTFSRA